jgi:acyl carrier protein
MNHPNATNPNAPTQAQIEQAVILAVSRTLRLPREQVHLSSRLYEDLGLDSMGLIHVNVSVEEQLNAALYIAEAPENELATVQDLVDFVTLRLSPAKLEALPC